MNLLSKLLLLLLINLKINEIKSKLYDSHCACETLNVDPIKSRIYNGTDVKSDELKYIGQIYTRIRLGSSTKKSYGYSSICTGFLINAQYALTSAFCVSFIKKNNDFQDTFFALAAPFGHNIRKARKNATYYKPIEAVYIHPNFDEENGDYNIGAIKFSVPFILGDDIQAACLIQNRWNTFSEKLYTAGYGVENIIKITNHDGTFYETESPKTLKIASGYVDDDCRMGKICLKSTESGTCPQDGGSPLLYNYDGRAVVIGINDRKTDDYDKCKSNIQTRFTRVGLITNWINTHFGDKCEAPNYLHKFKRCKCKAMSTQISRGINGTIIKNKNDFTYIAQLIQIQQEKREKNSNYWIPRRVYSPVCSGSLLNNRWILTAAQCIVFFDLANKIKQPDKQLNFDKKWQVGVLKHNLKELYDTSPWYNTVSPMSTIKSVNNHPKYSLNVDLNDIALIESTKVFNLVALGIYPPCLLDFEKYDYGNAPLIQAGFGADKIEDADDILKKIKPISRKISIIVDDDEYRIYASVLDLRATENFQVKCPPKAKGARNELICTTGFNQSPCLGDNGGPLIAIDREKNKEYLIGVQKGLQYSTYNKTHKSLCMPKGIKFATNLYPKMNFIRSFVGSDYCSALLD